MFPILRNPRETSLVLKPVKEYATCHHKQHDNYELPSRSNLQNVTIYHVGGDNWIEML